MFIDFDNLPTLTGGTGRQREYATMLRRDIILKMDQEFEENTRRWKQRSPKDRQVLLRNLQWMKESYQALLCEPDQCLAIWWIHHSGREHGYPVTAYQYFDRIARNLVSDRCWILLRDSGDHREYILQFATESEQALVLYQQEGGRAYLRKDLQRLQDLQERSGPLFPISQAEFNRFNTDPDYCLSSQEQIYV